MDKSFLTRNLIDKKSLKILKIDYKKIMINSNKLKFDSEQQKKDLREAKRLLAIKEEENKTLKTKWLFVKKKSKN